MAMRQDTKDTIDRYVQFGIPTGSFLYAVLTNNLFEAMGKADDDNRENIWHICNYIYNEITYSCWGSKQNVDAWINKGGLKGKNNDNQK